MLSVVVHTLLGWTGASTSDPRCPAAAQTAEFVQLLANRSALMAAVADVKGDECLVFDATQELRVLEQAGATARGLGLASAPTLVFAQLLADCAKQEQVAHLRREAAAAADGCDTGSQARKRQEISGHASLDSVRSELAELTRSIFSTWWRLSAPQGEWSRLGCQCARTAIAELLSTRFEPLSSCGSSYVSMFHWILLSAMPSCQNA
jgi:chorismate mutase